MANTPQAKQIRRNARRETINHSRISRIRTFIKAVESAIASGKKRPRLSKGTARAVPRSRKRDHSQNTASRKFSRLSKRVASLG